MEQSSTQTPSAATDSRSWIEKIVATVLEASVIQEDVKRATTLPQNSSKDGQPTVNVGLGSSDTIRINESDKRTPTCSIRAKHPRTRLVSLLVCISCLLCHLLGFDIGLRLNVSYIEPRLHRAEVQLQAALNGLVREQILYSRLDELLATSLDRRFTESYEECLARALREADATFLQLDFTQIPDIRNQTMNWAIDSCTKLMYTPQRTTPDISTYWTHAVNRYQRYAEEVLSLVKHKAAVLRIWLFSGNAQITAEPVAAGLVNNTASFSYPTVALPLGFDFDCDLPPPCRLVYSGPPGLTSNRTVVLEEAVIKAQKEVNRWSSSNRGVLKYIHNLIGGLIFLYLSLGSIFMLAISVIRYDVQFKSCLPTATTGVRPQLRNIAAYLQEDHPFLLESCFDVALYSLLHTQLPYITTELDRSLLPISVAFGVFHIIQIVRFFDPTSKATRSMRSFCRTMRELHLLAQGHRRTIITKCNCLKYNNKDTSSQAVPTNPASKIGARFISPLTTFSEDIQHERKIMHAEQGKQTSAELPGYATETDSEYESDTEFLNLPITTATPTPSENESDWAVVED
jgi:hypothetical protein